MHFFINGSFKEAEEATLPILDLGLLRGYGIFDYLRTYNQKPFHLQEHLARLLYSAHKTKLSVPYSLQEIQDIIYELILRSGPGEKSIKLLLTGGLSEDQLFLSEKTSFIAFAYPLKPYPATHFTQGIKTITTELKRSIPCSKTTQYLPAILALKEGREKGALESLYLNDQQEILEATTSNFFAFENGTLITPPEEGIMLGITRSVILRLAKDHFPIQIRPIPKNRPLDEAFVTASNKEVMPVTHIDDKPLGTGQVGPLTQKMMSLFADYTASENWPLLSIPRYGL